MSESMDLSALPKELLGNETFLALLARHVAERMQLPLGSAATNTVRSSQSTAESPSTSRMRAPAPRDEISADNNSEWPVDESIPIDPKLWDPATRAKWSRSCLAAWEKRGLESTNVPWGKQKSERKNGAVKDVLMEMGLRPSVQFEIRAKMKRKYEQRRTTQARVRRKGASADEAIDEEDMDDMASTKPPPKPAAKKVKKEPKPDVEAGEGTIDGKKPPGGFPAFFNAPKTGMSVVLRSAAGLQIATGTIIATGSKTVQKSTNKMLGKGNVLVKIIEVVGKFAKYAIPFPAGPMPEYLCDAETVIWPISGLSSKYVFFASQISYIACHRRHRRDEEASRRPRRGAPRRGLEPCTHQEG